MKFLGLGGWDWAILALYLIGMVLLGSRYSRKTHQTKDYYLAGRSMSWIPVGLSTVAALISGNTYLGLPSEVRGHGLAFLFLPLSIFFAVPFALRIFLPFYQQLQVTSAYEYLEKRFDVRVRCLASAMFVLWRLVWIAMIVYVPALAFSAVTGAPMLYTIVVLGSLTTLYTTLGGIEGVIWTDVVQFFVMFGGTILAIGLIASRLEGGLTTIWQTAAAAGRTEWLNLSWDPRVRMTLWGAVLGGSFANLAYLGVDQVVVQRYLTARSFQDARRSIILSSAGTWVVVLPLALLGLALFSFYRIHPGELPAGMTDDKVFPYFVASRFPVGLSGLLIAAICAATMSSLSSGINAITTAVDLDFYRRLFGKSSGSPNEQRTAQVRLARRISLLTGGLATFLACFVGRLGTIIEIALRVIDGFTGPLLGLFLLGMFSKRANASGACFGSCLGLLVTTYVNFWSDLSFTWYPVVGCVTTVLGGTLFSGLGKNSGPAALQWVYHSERAAQAARGAEG